MDAVAIDFVEGGSFSGVPCGVAFVFRSESYQLHFIAESVQSFIIQFVEFSAYEYFRKIIGRYELRVEDKSFFC